MATEEWDAIRDELMVLKAEYEITPLANEKEQIVTKATRLKKQIAKTKGEPCIGDCWFDGRCPRIPVCNE